jgi:hypothetical protein
MKLIRLLAPACLVAAPLSGALAQTQEPTKAVSETNPQVDAGAKKVCKSWTRTGTRIGQARVCKTQAQWDDEMFEMRSIINQTQGQKRVIDGQLGRDAYQNCLRC